MTRYKTEHREQTREAIVSAASGMLRERGFAGTGVADVMKAVGLTHGGFYAHFPDKGAMLIAALERAFVESPRNFAMLAGLANKTGDAGIIAEKYLSDRRVASVATACPAAALVSEMHRQPEVMQRTFQSGAEATAGVIASVDGLASGEGGEAWAPLAMLMGALSLMRAVPDASAREAIRAQVADALRILAAQPQSITAAD
jgi:TetR/AcrR family transcriptional regulator, transcriptional repressor for nem operon